MKPVTKDPATLGHSDEKPSKAYGLGSMSNPSQSPMMDQALAPTNDMHRSWQDRDLLAYLGHEAPRYTSYPSAHHFHALDPEPYKTWLRSHDPKTPISLYVHIPFCEQMCYFCGCNTRVSLKYEPIATYVQSLIGEIRLISELLGYRPMVHALHFGGGSPSILSPEDMTKLIGALEAAYDFLPASERSIELDPRRVNEEKIKTYQALGFNRVSLGVQDTQEGVQKAINRLQPMALLETTFALLRHYGFQDIGIDLIYGLPYQTQDSLKATLEDVKRLDPVRISAFSYAHVPWVKKHQTLLDESALPDLDAKIRAFLYLTDEFTKMGYVAIGMDHFAKPQDDLALALKEKRLRRNFMGYSNLPSDDLIGLGASSLGELQGGIMQNIPQSTTYQNKITSGQLATHKGWIYQPEDRLRKAIISSLMCYFEVDLAPICQAHGVDLLHFAPELEALKAFEAKGLIEISGTKIRFVSDLKMLIRTIACVFDTYAQNLETKPRYSKVA